MAMIPEGSMLMEMLEFVLLLLAAVLAHFLFSFFTQMFSDCE